MPQQRTLSRRSGRVGESFEQSWLHRSNMAKRGASAVLRRWSVLAFVFRTFADPRQCSRAPELPSFSHPTLRLEELFVVMRRTTRRMGFVVLQRLGHMSPSSYHLAEYSLMEFMQRRTTLLLSVVRLLAGAQPRAASARRVRHLKAPRQQSQRHPGSQVLLAARRLPLVLESECRCSLRSLLLSHFSGIYIGSVLSYGKNWQQ